MLNKFILYLKARDVSTATLKIINQTLVKAEKVSGKPLEDFTWDDLKAHFESLKANGQSKSTIWKTKTKFVQFYSFCFNETDNIKYSKLARQIKSINQGKPKSKVNPQDILFPEDIKNLINVATIERDRCIVAVLFESGMRIGELLALRNSMVVMDEQKQEVIFNIPDSEGCKTGGRTVVCLEIYGYVQDWLKCNKSERFIPMARNGVAKSIRKLFEKAGIKKPSNIHIFRHSSITNAVNIGMQHSALSMRFWGIPNSNMLSVYIHLSEQMQSEAYRNAKGMNGEATKVINPLASRCVECGRLIQSGNICKQCKENIDLKAKIATMENNMASMKSVLEGILNTKNTGIDINKVSFNEKNKKLKIKI